MAFKLTTMKRKHVPNVTFTLEDDTKVKNRELGPSEQVWVLLELADAEERADLNQAHYSNGSATVIPKKKRAVKKKVLEVRGLEDFGITDGKALINHEPMKELDDIIEDCYHKIIGTHDDDDGEGSDSGEMTAGE